MLINLSIRDDVLMRILAALNTAKLSVCDCQVYKSFFGILSATWTLGMLGKNPL